MLSRFEMKTVVYKSAREPAQLTPAELRSGLDVLLSSRAMYKLLGFTGAFELQNKVATQIIQSCEALSDSLFNSDPFKAWMQLTQASLRQLAGDECQPLVRRFVAATMVQQWIAAGKNFSSEVEKVAMELLVQVR